MLSLHQEGRESIKYRGRVAEYYNTRGSAAVEYIGSIVEYIGSVAEYNK